MPPTSSISCKLLPLLLLLSIIIYSCQGRKDNTNIKVLEEGLINSSKAIDMSSELALNSLNNKLFDPSTHSRAEIWFTHAQKIQELSKEIYGFIDGLKKESNPVDTKIASLYNKLTKYKNDVLSMDSMILQIFGNNLILTTKSFDTLNTNIDDFNKTFFSNESKDEIFAILTKFQNNIKIIENNLLIFCNENVGSFIDSFKTFSAIVGQNSKVLNPGQNIEITAGVGSFDAKCNPEIIIDGKKSELNEMGVVVYKKAVTNKPGIYSSPVMITFTNLDGIKESHKFTVEYTVAKPCDQ